MTDIFDFPPERFPEEITEILLNNKNVRIERILSFGHTTDWYDQNEDEWVCLLKGEAVIETDTSRINLKCGDTIFLPAHKRHRVIKTTKCIWLCVFMPGESFFGE